MTDKAMDLDRWMKLRLVVARFGEMDNARWWNTKGQLGRNGASVLKRGFPRTYRFAQARSVFAVAAQRCAEVFDLPGSVTLFRLPDAIEEALDAIWERWLDAAAEWEPFFESLEKPFPTDLPTTLRTLQLVDDRDLEAARKLRRAGDTPAVLLPAFTGAPHEAALLALGFSLGEPGSLVVPYARQDSA